MHRRKEARMNAKSPAKRRALVTYLSRAGVGLAITAVAAVAALVAGSFVVPTITVAPVAAVVDTARSASHTLTCNGSVLELGADPANPLLAIPVGTSTLTFHDATGSGTDATSFAREIELVQQGVQNAPASPDAQSEQSEQSDQSAQTAQRGANGSGVILELDGNQAYAEAVSESESVATQTLSGFTATQCVEPSNETWIVAGTTTLGSVSIVTLTNPGDVAATVFINVFDAEGPVDSLQTAGVVVPPLAQRSVSINGYAPDRASLAVQLLSRGAKVVATMQETFVEGLKPAGVETIQGTALPARQLVIPGITVPPKAGAEDVHGHSSGHTLRVLAPGDQGGVITATGVDAEGGTVQLVTEYLLPGVVTEFALETLTEEYSSVVIDAEIPVVASVTGFASSEAGEDIAWFTAAPEIAREIPIAIPEGPNPEVTVYNPGSESVTIELIEATGSVEGGNLSVTVPAKSSVRQAVKANTGYQLLTSVPVFAAVSFAGDGQLSGFAIVPPVSAADTVTVYTR